MPQEQINPETPAVSHFRLFPLLHTACACRRVDRVSRRLKGGCRCSRSGAQAEGAPGAAPGEPHGASHCHSLQVLPGALLRLHARDWPRDPDRLRGRGAECPVCAGRKGGGIERRYCPAHLEAASPASENHSNRALKCPQRCQEESLITRLTTTVRNWEAQRRPSTDYTVLETMGLRVD